MVDPYDFGDLQEFQFILNALNIGLVYELRDNNGGNPGSLIEAYRFHNGNYEKKGGENGEFRTLCSVAETGQNEHFIIMVRDILCTEYDDVRIWLVFNPN